MSASSGWRHWRLQRDADGLAWATLDRAAENSNVLTREVMAEFAALLDTLADVPPDGLVIQSGKAAGFIAGADVSEFPELDTLDKAVALVRRGWDLFNRLAALPCPTLALIRGHCLGGGLELALACRYRIAVDEPGTRLGLPEVMLGIVPGWGGMQRLPRLVGPQIALDLMLTGKTVDAKRARSIGLVDEIVAPRVMAQAARDVILSGKPARQVSGIAKLFNWPGLRPLVAHMARRQVAARARPEHYPAPYAILDLWARHDGNALADPQLIDRIVRSPTARNLVRVYFLQERLKSFGKEVEADVRRVHVVGAGVMGGDIAAWCTLQGLEVSLQDKNVALIAPAVARARKLFERRLKDRRLVTSAMDRLTPDPDGHGARCADLIIEAIVENLEAKQSLFKRLEELARPDAILATNTSSLKLEHIAQALKDPHRLVGIHFFNPVAQMPLVEVVEGTGTGARVLARACGLVRAIGKLPLPVKSAPGFLVNAVLAPYMLEAMRCVDEGIAPEQIDAAMLGFGMPMGPIELADTVGLDVALAAGRQIATDGEPPRCLAERVERKDLGRKTGRGFYEWSNASRAGRPRGSDTHAPAGLAERLVAPLVAAARERVAAGVVADADLADAGVIFGAGFAPFAGGPIRYAESRAARVD